MKKNFLLFTFVTLVAAVLCSTGAVAKDKKQRTFRLWGHVKDSFTKVGIPDVRITLMTADSAFIDSMTVKNGGAQLSKDSWYWFDRPVDASHYYIIKAEHPDYEDCYVSYVVKHVGRNTFFDAPWHLMKRKGLHSSMERNLEELVVKGSRVKLAYKGDTLVFDATAFRLPDGSMLDALIRQMPGVTLSDDGEITVNGRKVDYLMLNGKDFFKGNNKVMLENLPHYSVNNIRVYDRRTDKSEYVGRDIEEKDYVMDVTLKKEYSIGYMGNAETGVATEDRWMGRAFGSRFTDHSTVSAYVNMNNINEKRNPSGNGDWLPSNAPIGRRTTRQAGINVNIDDKDGRYKENMSIGVEDNDNTNSSSTLRTRFLPSGNVYSLSDSYEQSGSRNFSLSNNFRLQKTFWLELFTNMTLSDGNGAGRQRSAELVHNDDMREGTSDLIDSLFVPVGGSQLKKAMVNMGIQNGMSDNNLFYFYQKALFNKRLSYGDNIEFEANFTYENKGSKNYNDYRIDYGDGQTLPDYRNTYDYSPKKYYRYEVRGEYFLNFLSGWTWRLYTLYNQSNNNNSRRYYRMEQIDGWMQSGQPLGTLPDDVALLDQSLSDADSYHQNQMTRVSQSGLHFYYNKRTDSISVFLRFHLPLYVNNDKQAYVRVVVDTVARRTEVFFNGNINFNMQWNNWRDWIAANLYHNTILPSTYDMLDITDDTNPLVINKGNPRLKKEHMFRVNAAYSHRTKNRRLMLRANIDSEYHITPLITGYSYDTQTGVYTYQRQNGNRRWYAQTNIGMTAQPGKSQEWQLSADCFVKYDRREVFRMPTDASVALLYNAGDLMIWPSVSVTYTKGSFVVGAAGKVSYNKYTYDDLATEGYESCNYTVNGNVQYTVPVIDLQLSSTLLWNRQGYTVTGMPSQEYLIWNVFLSRSFLKDKSLVLKLNAFDLLNNVSHYSYWANEDWFSISRMERLNRYVMLSVAYQFKMKPKK